MGGESPAGRLLAGPEVLPPRTAGLAGVRDRSTAEAVGDGDCVLVAGEPGAVAAARAECPDALVVAIVTDGDRRRITTLLDAGAHGAVLRDAPPRALLRAVETVREGYLVVPARARDAVRRPVFTVRQKQVMGLLVLGLSNASIAARLFISESTVKMHVSAIFGVLGVGSRKEAVDVILDPASGLGTGILEIAPTSTRQEGYGSPRVE